MQEAVDRANKRAEEIRALSTAARLEEIKHEQAKRDAEIEREKEQKRLQELEEFVREGWLDEATAKLKGSTPEERAQQKREVINARQRRTRAHVQAMKSASTRKSCEIQKALKQAPKRSAKPAEAADGNSGGGD